MVIRALSLSTAVSSAAVATLTRHSEDINKNYGMASDMYMYVCSTFFLSTPRKFDLDLKHQEMQSVFLSNSYI